MLLEVFTEPERGASYDDLVAVAQHAEAAGFDGFFCADHYSPSSGDDPRLPGPTDAWTTLAGVARETQRIRLGTLVSPVTFRLPGPLAVQAAQVDEMSHGRVVLGLGAGHSVVEHAKYGIPFPELGVRFEMLEEQLAIVRGIWRTPPNEHFSYAGRHYRLDDCPALPKPRQQPHPPILIGGRGAKRTPRLAATYADELNVSYVPPDIAAEGFRRAADACERIGRDPATLRVSSTALLCCGEGDDLTRRADKLMQRRTAPQAQPTSTNVAFWNRYPGLGDVAEFAAVGTPSTVADRLLAYRDAGAQRMFLHFLDVGDLDQLSLIADQVMPRLQ